jgi:1,2-diacylglycerol 3-alpha-glucosyltransferase
VLIYNFISGRTDETRYVNEHLTVCSRHARSLGKQSLGDFDFVTEDADAVICFSDNQIRFSKLVRVCKKKGVLLLPYVGVLQSHSDNRWKKALLDLIIPNIRLYRRMRVLAKTPALRDEMYRANIREVVVAPVGLDEQLLESEYAKSDKARLRKELSLPENAEILFFPARMTAEKRPMEMLKLFEQLKSSRPSLYLAAVGDGELAQQFARGIEERGLADAVTYLSSVYNRQMWKYYCASDVMVNLNAGEIYGMAILEAMYYECPVVARRAPGPEFIITDGVDGFVCEEEELAEQITALCENEALRARLGQQAHRTISEHFLWSTTAELICKLIEEN